jgi:hypothetical protein
MKKEFLEMMDRVHARMVRKVADLSERDESALEDLAVVVAFREMAQAGMPEAAANPEPPKARRTPARRRKKGAEPSGEAAGPKDAPGQDSMV